MAKKAKSSRRNKNGATRGSETAETLLESLILLAEEMESDMDEGDLDQAQDKAFSAMEASDPRKRVALAKEALAISPLCADAYGVLAQEASQQGEALALYRQAVDVGRQALGEAVFTEDVGLFWGLLETRPYMRARHALARALWESRERDEAITHYQDMLRLNPDDNQGIRYCLVDALLELGRDSETD